MSKYLSPEEETKDVSEVSLLEHNQYLNQCVCRSQQKSTFLNRH